MIIACALAIAGCGGSDESEPTIPEPAGNALIEALDRVRQQVSQGLCDQAQTTAQNVRDAIDGLSDDLPSDLEQALVRGSDNLIQQIPEQCEEAAPSPPEEPTGATGEEGAAG
jgi:hypothetical protein